MHGAVLSEIWEGHCMQEGPGQGTVRSSKEGVLFLFLVALEVKHFCLFEYPQFEKSGKVISQH